MLSSFISRQTVNKSKPSGALFDVHGRTNVAGAGCTGATLGDFFLKKVLYMDVLMLRSHGCEKAAHSPFKGETNSKNIIYVKKITNTNYSPTPLPLVSPPYVIYPVQYSRL